MIMVYETPGCESCRKSKAWLKENGLKYQAVNMLSVPPSVRELKMLFSLADDIYDVVSERSVPVRTFKRKHGFDLEELSFEKLLKFLQENPNAIRRPLLTDGKVLVSGYDVEELTVLLPKEKRRISWVPRAVYD